MKKPYAHTKVSGTVKCTLCKTKPIKLNVLARKERKDLQCFSCYGVLQAAKGNFIKSAIKIARREGKAIGYKARLTVTQETE